MSFANGNCKHWSKLPKKSGLAPFSTLGLGYRKHTCFKVLTWYGQNRLNKAIRDGKYLARHMPVLDNVHHIKIENFDIFSWRHFSARSSCYIINWYGYQEVPMKNIWKKLSVQFLRYAFELLHVKRRTCHKWRLMTSDRHYIWHTYREYE